MSLIITATDFSEVSENAVHYACNLATSQNARVVIIHSFIIPVMFSDVPMPGSLITDAQNDAEEQMKKLVEAMRAAHPGITIDGDVIYGETVNTIDEFTEQNPNPWLVVIGNRGADDAWPDSTLLSAFRKMEYPVLAVPSHNAYKEVKRICFAFDNKHTGNDKALLQIRELTKAFSAELHVLTIQAHNSAAETGIDENVKSQLADINPSLHFITNADNVDTAIQQFNDANNIDWLILLPRKHSFFEGLFHKSHTKAIAHHTNIPILALHENN